MAPAPRGGIGTNMVTLPKEVAEAINLLMGQRRLTRFGVVQCAIVGASDYFTADQKRAVETIKKWLDEGIESKEDKLLLALVKGYEVEPSPEDRLREIYKNHADKPSIQPIWNEGVTWGIESALGILGITIEGINA